MKSPSTSRLAKFNPDQSDLDVLKGVCQNPFSISIDNHLTVILTAELMILILIIGILVAIAIPTYTSYLEKAKVTEAVGLMSGTKPKMAEYYSYYGHFPAKTEQLGIKTGGRYTTNIIINNGAITTTMRHNNLSLSLRPALPNNKGLPKVIAYVCGYATPPDGFMVQGENQTNIPPHYLSFTCK